MSAILPFYEGTLHLIEKHFLPVILCVWIVQFVYLKNKTNKININTAQILMTGCFILSTTSSSYDFLS